MTSQDASNTTGGQVDGADWEASDNADANANPQVADYVLGQGARAGVTDADRDLDDSAARRAGSGDTSQPRTGAETPVDAEDLVHARGQDVTDATLRAAQADLDAEGLAAVEREVPDLSDTTG